MKITKKRIILGILIAFLAFFLREHLAYYGAIEADESTYFKSAVLYNTAIRLGDSEPIFLSTFNYEHPQFYKLIYSLGLMAGKPVTDTSMLRSYHNSVAIQTIPYWHKFLILRTISALLGAATVFIVSLLNPLAGFFLAINTYAIKYTSVIYLEALPSLTNLISLLTAIQALKYYQLSSSDRKKWIGWLILSALTLGMTAASKYIYAVIGFVIVITIIILGRKNERASFIGLAIWGVLSLLFFLLFDPVLWHNPIAELTKSLSFSLDYSNGAHVREVGYSWWQPIKWLSISIPQYVNKPWAFNVNAKDYFISIDTLICALSIIGIPFLFKKDKPMFIWLLVGMGFLFAWATKWPQYIMVVLVPFCFSASYGFQYLYSLFQKRKAIETES